MSFACFTNYIHLCSLALHCKANCQSLLHRIHHFLTSSQRRITV